MFNAVLFILAAVALIVSWRKDREKTGKALQIAKKQLLNLLPSMLGIIGLIGLMLALVPREVIAGFLGNDSPLGIFIISIIGSITLIPAFIGFPLGASLIDAGASVTAVACFLTTVLMVGVVTAPMEIELFGKRFTIWRNLLGLVMALVIGIIMGVVLQ
ncbi:hypothetical protein [Desulfoscipio gibsoniae]|uniref:Putative permease n=1 Tax=Desulfoscipio gibsoniae DSM 7213 TaxID=767817 RepID=R4KHT6_9FIRM|nr:hypothetical protein [Desulfoscipio gibsoniae]AGL02179.1 putative permease [Desulfoscipio gibsoniae DSM 7213]